MEDLKKIFIIAAAVALGLLLFYVALTFLGFVIAVILDLVVLGALVYLGLYIYRKYFQNKY